MSSALLKSAPTASPAVPLRGDFERMARRRYQKGQLIDRGGHWVGRWREDVIVEGQIKRPYGWHFLGTKKDYPTQRLALRALEDRLCTINNPSYRPRPVAKFSEFADKWQKIVLPNLKPSCHAPIRSQLRKHLVPTFGAISMKDFTGDLVQSFVTGCSLSPKTKKNLIGTLSIMWNSAKAWDYVSHNPFDGLVLPKWDEPEQPVFSAPDVQRIIATVDPYYRPALWMVIQTGIRRGELCALNVGDVDFAACVVYVRRSRSGKYITNTKSKRPRDFYISPALAACLKGLAADRPADDPLFLSKVMVTSKKQKVVGGKRLHPDNFYARVVAKVVRALGLKGGLHAFRHGNATAQDKMGVPMKTRMERLGHVNSRTTMGYTHELSEEARRVPEMLDEYFEVKGMVQ